MAWAQSLQLTDLDDLRSSFRNTFSSSSAGTIAKTRLQALPWGADKDSIETHWQSFQNLVRAVENKIDDHALDKHKDELIRSLPDDVIGSVMWL